MGKAGEHKGNLGVGLAARGPSCLRNAVRGKSWPLVSAFSLPPSCSAVHLHPLSLGPAWRAPLRWASGPPCLCQDTCWLTHSLLHSVGQLFTGQLPRAEHVLAAASLVLDPVICELVS